MGFLFEIFYYICGDIFLNYVIKGLKMNNDILYFHHACVVDDIETIMQILDSVPDFNINCADDDGDTALHKAVLFENYDITKYLLDMRCSKNRKNNYGWTALDMAIVNRDKSIVKLLNDYGANESVVDKQWLHDILYND